MTLDTISSTATLDTIVAFVNIVAPVSSSSALIMSSSHDVIINDVRLYTCSNFGMNRRIFVKFGMDMKLVPILGS